MKQERKKPGRKLKEYRVKLNGPRTLQVFRQGEFVGSIHLARLCSFIELEKRRRQGNGTAPD